MLMGLFGTFFVGAKEMRKEEVQVMQQHIAKEVLRFHVRANSNEKEDQRIKMLVKKQVITYLQPVLETANSVEQTKMRIEQCKEELEQTIEETLAQEDADYGATVELRQEVFPEKNYGDCTFPAGNYEALVIYLGTGNGNNWWCMLYPGLCFVDEATAVVSEEKKAELQHLLTEEEYTFITNPEQVEIDFRWLPNLFQ